MSRKVRLGKAGAFCFLGRCGEHVAGVARSGEREAFQVGRIRRADAMHRGDAFGVNPASVNSIERQDTVEFEAAIWPDAGLGHFDGVQQFDGV